MTQVVHGYAKDVLVCGNVLCLNGVCVYTLAGYGEVRKEIQMGSSDGKLVVEESCSKETIWSK